jgi:hypothetical protein
MVEAVVVVTNPIQLVLMVDLVVVDLMVVVVETVYIQVHLLLMLLDRVILVDLVNPQLLVAAVVLVLVVLLLPQQTLEMVVLDCHIVFLVVQHSMLVVEVVDADQVELLELVDQV